MRCHMLHGAAASLSSLAGCTIRLKPAMNGTTLLDRSKVDL